MTLFPSLREIGEEYLQSRKKSYDTVKMVSYKNFVTSFHFVKYWLASN